MKLFRLLLSEAELLALNAQVENAIQDLQFGLGQAADADKHAQYESMLQTYRIIKAALDAAYDKYHVIASIKSS